MNILYVDANGTISDNYMYKYYGDLFRELKELSSIYVYQGNPSSWPELLSKSSVDFDAIIFGLGYFAQSDASFFGELRGLKEVNPVKVSMFHKPQNLFKEKVDFCNKNEIDI